MTNEHIKALGDLIAAVKRGDPNKNDGTLYLLFGDDWVHAWDVIGWGSLNAAKALHDALLPGWVWKLESYDGFSLAWVGPPSEMLLREHETDINNPARAWLIAILKAYRAKMEAS